MDRLSSELRVEQTVPTAQNGAASTQFHGLSLPDVPLLTIKPQRRWAGLDLREHWAHRELLYFLTWRNVKVRYKQTVLGVARAILQPVTSMVLFTLFFGKMAQMPSDGIPYPIFAYAELLPWTFVSTAVSGAGDSLGHRSRSRGQCV